MPARTPLQIAAGSKQMNQPSIINRPGGYRLKFQADYKRSVGNAVIPASCIIEASNTVGQALLNAHEAARKQIGPCRLVKVDKL